MEDVAADTGGVDEAESATDTPLETGADPAIDALGAPSDPTDEPGPPTAFAAVSPAGLDVLDVLGAAVGAAGIGAAGGVADGGGLAATAASRAVSAALNAFERASTSAMPASGVNGSGVGLLASPVKPAGAAGRAVTGSPDTRTFTVCALASLATPPTNSLA